MADPILAIVAGRTHLLPDTTDKQPTVTTTSANPPNPTTGTHPHIPEKPTFLPGYAQDRL